MRKNSGPGRRAFTLIELLVSIAIIAVLISVLVPTLGRAKAQARVSLCLSNQRQLTQASILFATERDGFFPGEGQNYTLATTPANTGGTGVGQDLQLVTPATDAAPPDSALLITSYVGSRRLFACPEIVAHPEWWMGTRTWLKFFNFSGFTYTFNAIYAGGNHTLPDPSGSGYVIGVSNAAPPTPTGAYSFPPGIYADYSAWNVLGTPTIRPMKPGTKNPANLNSIENPATVVWVRDGMAVLDVAGKGAGNGFDANGGIKGGGVGPTYAHGGDPSYTAPGLPANGAWQGFTSSAAATAAHGDHSKVVAGYFDGHAESQPAYYVDPVFGTSNTTTCNPYQCYIPSNN